MKRLGILELHETAFVRYLGSSGIALGADATTFFALVAIGSPAGPASALAYALGILVHWLITTRTVFAAELEERGPPRNRQKMLFVLSAVAGLGVTTAIVSSGAAVGVNLGVTKAFAVAVSFTMNWLLRRWLVFRPQVAQL